MSASDELIDPESFFADLKMQAEETTGPIVVFEGLSDLKVLRKHFSDSATTLYSGGKKNIEKCVKDISKIDKEILFLADSDFESLQPSKNIIYTQSHDFFIDVLSVNIHILHSIAFDYMPDPGIFRPQEDITYDIVQKAVNYAHVMAKIRLAISRGYLPKINLKKFNFAGTCRYPKDKDIFQLVSKRSKGKADVDSIERAVKHIDKTYTVENFGLIGDHDLIEAFRKSLVDENIAPRNGEEITEKIISSIHCSLLIKTDVFKLIKEWCISYYQINPYRCEIAA